MPAFTIITLPREYQGHAIKKRLPFVMAGDLIVPPASSSRVFPDGTFVYSQDLPFEVMRLVPNVSTLDTNGALQADPASTDKWAAVQIQVQLLGSVRFMTLVQTRLSALIVKGDKEWVFEHPLYIERGAGFAVTVSNGLPSAVAAGGIRMEIGFVGSLLELGA
jgi:hypothetical protein